MDIRPRSKVIKSQLGSFGFDGRQLKAIEDELMSMPLRYRAKAIIGPMKTALGITKRQAAANARASARTGNLAKAIQVVEGKDKRYTYVVLRVNPRTSYYLPAPAWMDRGQPQLQRPIKYAHLVAGGTKAGLRTNRELQDGRRKHFTVRNEESGKVHRLSQWLTPKKPGIQHPGTPANNFIEDAWTMTQDQAEAKFRDIAIDRTSGTLYASTALGRFYTIDLDDPLNTFQEVKAGEKLAVIEAMKMENILKAEQDCKVKKIAAAVGESLSVDQMIIEFE